MLIGIGDLIDAIDFGKNRRAQRSPILESFVSTGLDHHHVSIASNLLQRPQ